MPKTTLRSIADWNGRRLTVGIQTDAGGAKTWVALTKNPRAFKLEEQVYGLVPEEWQQEGGSFTAKASWRKRFRLEPSNWFAVAPDILRFLDSCHFALPNNFKKGCHPVD